MIVVTSTAKHAGTLAGACVESVHAAAGRSPVRVRHVYYAADPDTARIARAVARAGAEVRESPAPALANMRECWSELRPSDVVVWLDGDDTLAPDALEHVVAMYAPGRERDTLATYGSFIRDDGMPDWKWHAHFGRRYAPARWAHRREPWRASHLRTFRAGVVQCIPEAYLRRHGGAGEWFPSCTDLAVMLPVLDLVGQRYEVSTRPLCTYTYAHSMTARRPAECEALEARDRPDIAGRVPLAELPYDFS